MPDACLMAFPTVSISPSALSPASVFIPSLSLSTNSSLQHAAPPAQLRGAAELLRPRCFAPASSPSPAAIPARFSFVPDSGDQSDEEEKLKGKPGYEHLNEPLHVLIEAELPANIIDTRLRQAQEIMEELLKPVDESQDFYKRQQLRELAMLNSTLREDSPHPGSVSPFSNGGMKRAKPSQ